MRNRFTCIFILCGILAMHPLSSYDAHGADPHPGNAVETGGNTTPSPATQPASPENSFFSPPYDDTPVAMVDDEPITKYDLFVALAQQGEEVSSDPGERYRKSLSILNRLINSRLIVMEAGNIGLDETDEVRNQVEDFKQTTLQRELMRNHLQGFEPDPAEVEELYRKISREVKLHSLVFPAGPGARRFLEDVKDKDFEQLVKTYIEEGKVEERKGEGYVKIKDFRPEVAQDVYSMEEGGLSKIYQTEDGYLLYRLVDSRFVEDPPVREEAARIVTENMRRNRAMEYSFALEEKYVTLDEDLYNQLDFNTDFEQLLQDKRVLVRAKGEGESFVVTVADLASSLKKSFFHGADKAKTKMIDERKDATLANMIFMYTSEREARRLGLDQTDEFKRQVDEFERSTIFSAFMNKVLLPRVKVSEEEVRTYYDEHIDEFSSPAMLRMKSLVFNKRQEAESALDKLRKGADYNWVSANSSNLVAPDAKGVLALDRNLLSRTALPEDLQEMTEDVKKGDTLLYTPSQGDFFYVLAVEDVFPPEAQPYEQAKGEAAKKVFNANVEKSLDEWVAKLREAYPVQIFLPDPNNTMHPAETGMKNQ